MVEPISATLFSIGYAAKELWDYNRQLFKYDENQRLERDLTALELKVKQFELFREDIRDLVELTVGRMDIYHVVGAMLLEFTVVFYCEGRIHAAAPPWILLLFFGCLSSAFCFLIQSVWLSMHASVCSHSFGVRLLTRFVRLPIPSSQQLNQARTKYAQFEKSGFKNMFRIPFISKEQVWQGDAKEAGAADQLGTPDPKKDVDDIPAMTTVQQIGEATMPLGHIELYRRLQARWQCYDAYSRVCMCLGVNQIIHSVAIFICAHMLIEQYAPFGVLFTVVPLELCNLLILNLDVREAERWEFVMAVICTFGPALCTLVSLTIYRESRQSDPNGTGWSMFISQIIASVGFLLCAVWYTVVKRFAQPEELNGSYLPYRFRAVLYLDVFGDVKPTQQKRTKSRAWEDEKYELLRRLQDACDNLNASPLEAMQDLQSAAVEGVAFLDTYQKDPEVERLVTKAAVFFEEHKFRIEEDEIRQKLQQWQSAKVASYQTESEKKDLDTHANHIKEVSLKIKKFTGRRPRAIAEMPEFSYNRATREITVQGQGSGRTFADFGNAVKKFEDMANELESTIEKFRLAGVGGDPDQQAWALSGSPKSAAHSQSAMSTGGGGSSSKKGDKPTPIIEMHDMGTLQAPEFAEVTEKYEAATSFYPDAKTTKDTMTDHMNTQVSFMGRSINKKAYTFNPEQDLNDEDAPKAETLPWLSLRVILNLLLLVWFTSGILSIVNAAMPGYLWGWGDAPRQAPEVSKAINMENIHSDWPTPHFEINQLHCLDDVYVDNPYGARWKVGDIEGTMLSEAERLAPGTTKKVVATFGKYTVGAMAGDRVLIFLEEQQPSRGDTDVPVNSPPTYALPIKGDDVEFVGEYRLAVLHDNQLSLWNVLTGEKLGQWEVEQGAKSFCHTADHIYIGAASGLHRAEKPGAYYPQIQDTMRGLPTKLRQRGGIETSNNSGMTGTPQSS